MIPISQAPIYPQEILKTISLSLEKDKNYWELFQDGISNYLKCNYVNLTSSGFSGLYSILTACNLKKGSEVIIPAYTCEDIPRLVVEMGFKPKFVDIEPHTYNLDPEDLCNKISSNTKVVLAAHMFGYPCTIETITEISHDHRAIVIEDSCQSIGAEYKGKKVGTFGDVGLFSLNMGKPISTINGGIVCTNNREIYENICAVINKFKRYNIIHQIRTFTYMIGYSLCNYNSVYSLVYRLMGSKNMGETNLTSYSKVTELMRQYTKFQAALGVQQLSKLDEYNNVRIKNASYITGNLDRNDLSFPKILKQTKPTFSRLPIYFENMNKEKRKSLVNAFLRAGIETTPYLNNSLPHMFNKKGSAYPVAERMAEKTLTIPTHPNMNIKNLDQIINQLNYWEV